MNNLEKKKIVATISLCGLDFTINAVQLPLARSTPAPETIGKSTAGKIDPGPRNPKPSEPWYPNSPSPRRPPKP
jgi:hypothetical protein